MELDLAWTRYTRTDGSEKKEVAEGEIIIYYPSNDRMKLGECGTIRKDSVGYYINWDGWDKTEGTRLDGSEHTLELLKWCEWE